MEKRNGRKNVMVTLVIALVAMIVSWFAGYGFALNTRVAEVKEASAQVVELNPQPETQNNTLAVEQLVSDDTLYTQIECTQGRVDQVLSDVEELRVKANKLMAKIEKVKAQTSPSQSHVKFLMECADEFNTLTDKANARVEWAQEKVSSVQSAVASGNQNDSNVTTAFSVLRMRSGKLQAQFEMVQDKGKRMKEILQPLVKSQN